MFIFNASFPHSWIEDAQDEESQKSLTSQETLSCCSPSLLTAFGDLTWENPGILGQEPLVTGAQSHCHLLGGCRALGYPRLGHQAQQMQPGSQGSCDHTAENGI